MIRKTALVIAFLGFGLSASADPVDLSSWSALSLTFPTGQPAGSWILGPGNTYVDQVVNADPSFYLNNLNQTSYSMDGSFEVRTAGDDDYVGFVFGYQNSSNFYLFDWKQEDQEYGQNYATEGMTIKKMTGSTGDGLVDLSLAEFFENEHDYEGMDVLAQNQGSTMGWADNTVYDFHLDFNQNPDEIHVVVTEGAVILWDVTVTDSTFSSGEFGFYNYSQALVRYSGFEQTGGVIVDVIPAPGAALLAGIGACFAGWMRRRRSL